MATSSDISEITVSPLPRAPPPSPEIPSQLTNFDTFDFTAALLSNSASTTNKPRSIGPSPTSSSRDNSGPASPSLNDSGSYGHSPFFYPSPDHYPSYNSPSPSRSSVSTPAAAAMFEPRLLNEQPPTQTNCLSTSMPVNGDLQYLQQLLIQQNQTTPFGNNHAHVLSGGMVEERKRKVSLKRPHTDEFDQTYFSTSYEKKVRSEESNSSSVMFRSYPQQRPRASTFSGALSSYTSCSTSAHQTNTAIQLSNNFNHLSLTPGGVVDQGVGPLMLLGNNRLGGGQDSHVTPQSMQTIGFAMSDDDAMDTSSATKISITREEISDHTSSMECSYGNPDRNHSSNRHSNSNHGYDGRSPYSFNVDSLTHLHPNYSMGTPYGNYFNGHNLCNSNSFYQSADSANNISSFSKSL